MGKNDSFWFFNENLYYGQNGVNGPNVRTGVRGDFILFIIWILIYPIQASASFL